MTPQPWGLPPDLQSIPYLLRSQRRWVVWKAVPKQGQPDKFDKVPRQAANGAGASTNTSKHWCGFKQAAQAYLDSNGELSGVGYVLSDAPGLEHHNVFAIDIDHCDADDPRLAEALQLGTYVERSPSARGYRVFGKGMLPGPAYSNHEDGIEFYDHTSPRYVTVTGRPVAGCIADIHTVAAGRLNAFYERHQTRSRAATTVDASRPPVLPAEWLAEPPLIPTRLQAFWNTGDPAPFVSGSEATQALFVHLASAGLDAQEVFSRGVHHVHTYDRYLRARQGDAERALQLLWDDVQRAAAHAEESPAAVATDPSAFPELAPESQELASKPRQRLFVRAADLTDPAPPVWVVKGWLERGSLAVLFGDPSAGKSFVAIDIALAVARGVDWNGRKVKQGGVVYIAGEGYKGIARRLQASAIHHDFELGDVPLIVSRLSVAMSDREAVRKVIDELAVMYTEDQWRSMLIVIDTLRRNFGIGDENNAEDMGRFIDACALLAQVTGATILVVHHTGHGERGRERGSSVITSDFDARFQLEAADGVLTLTPKKLKDALLPAPMTARLETVSLGYQDEDGDDITSAVPVWSEAPEARSRGSRVDAKATLRRSAKVALQTLSELMTTQYLAAPEDCRLLGATRVVSVSAWRDAALARGIDRTDDRASARRTWNRCKSDLIASGYVLATDDAALAWTTEEGEAAAGNPLYL